MSLSQPRFAPPAGPPPGGLPPGGPPPGMAGRLGGVPRGGMPPPRGGAPPMGGGGAAPPRFAPAGFTAPGRPGMGMGAAPSKPPAGPTGASNGFGTLKVVVLGAKDLPIEKSKCQSFISVKVGGNEIRSGTADGSTRPRYHSELMFDIRSERDIDFALYFIDPSTSLEELAGKGRANFMAWIAAGTWSGDVALTSVSGGPIGSVSLNVKFERTKQQAPPGAPESKANSVPSSGVVSAPSQSEVPRDPNSRFSDQEIRDAFNSFDLDKNGFVGAAELKHVMQSIGEKVTDDEIDCMIAMADHDGDGQTSFAEFYELLTGTKLPSADQPVAKSDVNTGALRNARRNALEEFASKYAITVEVLKQSLKRLQMSTRSGESRVDYAQFAEILVVDPSPTVEKTFLLFDIDKSGLIDIKEFLIGLCNFTDASKDTKLKFSFSVFDENGDGVITKDELVKILKGNHMSSSTKDVVKKADTILAQADKDGDGAITFEEFAIVSKRFPNILYPSYVQK